MGNQIDSELHLFIIWEHARYKQNEIIEDMNKKFNIINVYDVQWSQDKFSENLSRFYGAKLPNGSFKEKHCGRGKFLLVILEDKNPTYKDRPTSRGPELVNVNLFDAKTLYREWTGGGHKIHGTNSEVETNHDLTLLLGVNVDDFKKNNTSSWNGQIQELKRDLIGAGQWDNIEQMFYVLNSAVNYLVLRNFECLPYEYNMESHGDIDLLTDNYNELCYVINAKKVFKTSYRVHHKVKINGEDVLFDFRFVGDGYYDTKWENHLLDSKVMKNNFYQPDDCEYFYSLLYHALIHKKMIAPDYSQRLEKLALDLNIDEVKGVNFQNLGELKSVLNSFMKKNNYSYTEPVDLSVYYNYELIDINRLTFKRRFNIYKQKILKPIKDTLRPIKNSLR